jgi:hypothetical protein
MNKFHAKAEVREGKRFHSGREAKRYKELQLLERQGLIKDLRRQVRYILIPTQYDDKGKLVERCCNYYADFVYKDQTGKVIVEDSKGFKTQEYIIKRKLMLQLYGIRILET